VEGRTKNPRQVEVSDPNQTLMVLVSVHDRGKSETTAFVYTQIGGPAYADALHTDR
jgi:hypothetical protein